MSQLPPDHSDVNVSAEIPDWSRERIVRFWEPGKKLIRAIRRYQAARQKPGALADLTAKYWVMSHWFWSLVTQCDIPLNTQIGGGLRLPHPQGIVINPNGSIGPNCMIFHQVTLTGGVNVGGHVDFGAGCKVIGPVTVGDHVTIGANAVVTKDLPSDCAAMGVPAKVRE